MDCCVVQRELDHMVSALRWNGHGATGIVNLREGDPTLAYFAGSYMNYQADRLNKATVNRDYTAILGGILPPEGDLCFGGVAPEEDEVTRRARPCKRWQPGGKGPSQKPRLAVLSNLWSPGHPVHRGYIQAIAALKDDFHLTLVHLGPLRSDIDRSAFDESTVLFKEMNRDASDIQHLLRNDFDVAFFPDCGMTWWSLLLANVRFSPVQLCGYSHPSSTHGATAIDWWLAGSGVERLVGHRERYSERLLLLPGFGEGRNKKLYHAGTSPPPALPAASSVEATATQPLVIGVNCAAQKLTAPFVRVVRRILRLSRVPVKLRLFSYLHPDIGFFAFEASLKEALEPGSSDIDLELVSLRPHDEYTALLRGVHVFLDSFPFGGSNVVLDALQSLRPVLTMLGSHWHARIGPRTLEQLGLDDQLVAHGEEEYVRLASRLINDDGYRRGVTERIAGVSWGETIALNEESERHFGLAMRYLAEKGGSHGGGETGTPGKENPAMPPVVLMSPPGPLSTCRRDQKAPPPRGPLLGHGKWSTRLASHLLRLPGSGALRRERLPRQMRAIAAQEISTLHGLMRGPCRAGAGVMDVGAGAGWGSLLLVAMGCAVIAIEPQPMCAAGIRQAATLNPTLPGAVEVVVAAAAREPHVAYLAHERGCEAEYRMVPVLPSGKEECHGSSRLSRTTTVDAIAAGHEGKLGLLRISAGGAEVEVLRGSMGFLAHSGRGIDLLLELRPAEWDVNDNEAVGTGEGLDGAMAVIERVVSLGRYRGEVIVIGMAPGPCASLSAAAWPALKRCLELLRSEGGVALLLLRSTPPGAPRARLVARG